MSQPSVVLRQRWLWWLLLAIALFRLLSLGTYPLMDTTESRYAEIARIMVETGNWVTPQIDYDVPFWGKPPLYAWASAISIALLGNHEFSQRLPHFLAAVAILWLIWQFTRSLGVSRRKSLLSTAIVATSVGYIITAGTVMTDTLLTLGMALAMIGFWRGWHGEKRWTYLMYVGLAIGLLAKGPLIIVLVGLALFPWLVWQYGLLGMWKEIWLRLYPLSGLALMFAIALPWYLLAERATPGFLQYFIIGEHFQRFLDSGWQGDLYGSGHARPKGSIWLFWLVFAFPWSFLLLWKLQQRLRGKLPAQSSDPQPAGLSLFLALWLISPMLLFSMAANILPAYVLPGMPALGLILVLAFPFAENRFTKWLFLTGPLIAGVVILLVIFRIGDQYSEKAMLEQGIDSSDPVFYLTNRPYSAQFYTDGQAKKVLEPPLQGRFYLVIKPAQQTEDLTRHCQRRSANAERILLFCQR